MPGYEHLRDNEEFLAQPLNIRRRVEELTRDIGLPLHLATKVARGEMQLTEAIDQHQSVERVDRLIQRHGLERSLAVQIVKGKVSLDTILKRKRMKEHLAGNRETSILEAAMQDGRPRIFALHGKRVLVARVKAVSAYEVHLIPLSPDGVSSGEEVLVHKLQFKMGARAAHATKVEQALTMDSDRDEIAEPIEKPAERYRCADKKLFGWLDAKSTITLTSLEGDVVTGELTWIGRWELGLTLKSGVEVVVFRHALANISGGRWDSSKDD